MPSARELLIIAHHDPRERLVCPACNAPFIGGNGMAYHSEYMREGNDWTVGYLLYCSSMCVLQANPTLGSC